jgi:hypothetical protein
LYLYLCYGFEFETADVEVLASVEIMELEVKMIDDALIAFSSKKFQT